MPQLAMFAPPPMLEIPEDQPNQMPTTISINIEAPKEDSKKPEEPNKDKKDESKKAKKIE